MNCAGRLAFNEIQEKEVVMIPEDVKQMIDAEIAPLKRKLHELQIAIDTLRSTSTSGTKFQASPKKTENKIKILIIRDENMELFTGVKIEACTALIDRKGTLNIIGEIASANAQPISDYVEIQVLVFDSDGDLVNRQFTNWSELGLRQSFEFEIEPETLAGSTPTKVKVYPAK